MICIDDVLLSDDIVEEHFVCNLKACNGACCWEGDYGAPLTKAEIEIIKSELETVKKYLPENSITIIENEGFVKQYSKKKFAGTGLHNNGACIFLTDDSNKGLARCAFEMAYKDGVTKFRKPISCHLYPIRVIKNEEQGFEAWNYDRWDICSDACTMGKELKMPLYKFAKDAIIRAKGENFYEQIEAYVEFQGEE